MNPPSDPIDFNAMDDDRFQQWMLEGVSRTFALTIPQLPAALRAVVANAYLLCRIADTIEDDPALDAAATERFSERWIRELERDGDGVEFARALLPCLSDAVRAEEKALVARIPRVLTITRGFTPGQRQALIRCAATMARGMARFQRRAGRDGLRDLREHDAYCYFVAGVVGECLTTLFVDYSGEIARHRQRLMDLSLSFGQGLQMTNILKDLWDDWRLGVCWLPRSVFAARGFDLLDLTPTRSDPAFQRGLGDLIALARGRLERALEYTLLIPARERGIRNFCLWAIGMALLTLRKLDVRRDFRCGKDVKISRWAVRGTILASRLTASSDRTLRWLFRRLAAPLPALPPDWRQA